MKTAEQLSPGTRVYSNAIGQEGVVIRLFGDMATVRFPSGERTVPNASLETVLVDPLDLIAAGRFSDEPEWFDIKLRAAKLQAAYGSDNLSGLVNSRVVLRPHQIFLAHKILEKPRPSMILADEVGLGKTVEAGLVLKELLARKSVARTLIIVPPNLLNQWQTELRVKFNEPFEIVDSALLKSTRQLYPDRNPWLRFPRALMSSYLARAEEGRDELVRAGWDLLIVDEAHHCRRKMQGRSVETTHLYRTVDLLKDSTFGVLLLTATPMQLQHFELFSLVELVEPGLYQDHEDFEADIAASFNLRSIVRALQNWDDTTSADKIEATTALGNFGVVADCNSPVGREDATDKLVEGMRLTQSIVRNRKRTVGGFTRRRGMRVAVDLTHAEGLVHQMVERYLRQGFAAAKQRQDRGFGLELVAYQRIMASSSRALARALETRKRRLLDEQIESLQVTDDPDERLEGSRTLALANLREEFAAIDELISELQSLQDSKAAALVGLVRQILEADPTEKILIFTQYYGTQDLLMEALGRQFDVVQFRGSLTRWQKDDVVRQFREKSQVMVSTEAGGEGRNFQFCHIIINYDLHWNPMRIEQRIGRLDRYGQTRDVHIYNIVARGTIEDRLVEVLETRLHLFEAAVGALELILGEVEEDLRKAVLQASGDAERAADIFVRDLELRLRDAERVETQSADFLIEIGSFRRETADRLTAELEDGRVMTDLELLIIRILSLFPTADARPEGEVWSIKVPPALGNAVGQQLHGDYRGTFSAAFAVSNESLEFFGFGHPLVDACLEYSVQYAPHGLAAIRRLPADVLPAPALELHYLVEFTGVRKHAEVRSLVLDMEGNRNLRAEAELPLAEPAGTVPVVPSGETLESLRTVAMGHIRNYVDEWRPEVTEINQKRVLDELRRAERIRDYNARRVSERVRSIQENIQRLEAEGDPEQRRIIPALGGQIDGLRRELLAIDDKLKAHSSELERLKQVSESFQLLSAGLLVPVTVG